MHCLPIARHFGPLTMGITLLMGAASALAATSNAGDTLHEYQLTYTVTPDPGNGTIQVVMTVQQPRDRLREVRFDAPPARFTDVSGDGEVHRDGKQLNWSVPATGGKLKWEVGISHRRDSGGYDAWLGNAWGVFRAEDIIPAASTRALKNARSDTRLEFRLPAGWSSTTEYFGDGRNYRIHNGTRHFDQPAGWILIGKLGIRREDIAGVRVAIAGPIDESIHRLDRLALLNWTLPELARILPTMPKRLTVISAGDPMWRGGLSAPQSMFLHADRPLISENGTSTLLHEVMHVAMRARPAPDDDWIVEGLAEYYGLQLLRRSGTISADRYQKALDMMQAWSASAHTLCGASSTGATTALAVLRFKALDQEIRNQSSGKASLDDVLVAISDHDGIVSLADLQKYSMAIMGKKPDALRIDQLPGCNRIDTSRKSTNK